MTPEKFDDDLPQDFMHGFYGYGSFAGDYWFVGMEEGGGNSFAEIKRRLDIWDEFGKAELLDVADFHFRLGTPKFFRDRVKLQPTWNKLSRIVLSSNGQEVTLQAVRQYQKNHLGRIGKQTCLIELLPLPSPSTGKWLYAQYSELPFLKSRKTYREHILPVRIETIRNRVRQYRPRAVVFYGMGYQQWWREIAGLDYKAYEPFGFLVAKNKQTLFVISNHPVATRVTNEYFHQIGRLISAQS